MSNKAVTYGEDNKDNKDNKVTYGEDNRMLRCAVSGGEERSSEVDWQKERGGDKEQPACPHLGIRNIDWYKVAIQNIIGKI